MTRLVLLLPLSFLALFVAGSLHAAPNKVLEHDGSSSYVELPTNSFANLTQATVEVWAKWDGLRAYARVFEFGAAWQSMSLFNHDRYPDLRFNLYPLYAKDNRARTHNARANNILRVNEWIHIAAVSGPGGMQLFANGNLVAIHTNEASFADIQVAQTNLIGTGLVRNVGDQDFRGQIDELRVWDHRRTEAQIRENMGRRLTGKEPGLAGLWNFDDGSADDSSRNGFPGKFMGLARAVPATPETNARLLSGEPQEPVAAAPKPVSPAPELAAAAPARDWGIAVWLIAGALTVIAALLVSLMFMLRRTGIGPRQELLPAPAATPLLADAAVPGGPGGVDSALKEKALAQLAEFAKESLVQGLYSQQKALLETQQNAYRQLAELETRLGALHLPDRIQEYEKRIAELEKELETRKGEVRELTAATLLLLRRKLEEEKQLEKTRSGFAS